MKAVLRAALVIVASLAIAAGGATSVFAADSTPPPTVGGTLSVSGTTITILSSGNRPAHIVLTASTVTLSESAFDLQPGQSHDVTYKGAATGEVNALYSVIGGQLTGESGSAQLTLHLKPSPVLTGSLMDQVPWVPIIAFVLFLIVLIEVARWARRHIRFSVSRVQP